MGKMSLNLLLKEKEKRGGGRRQRGVEGVVLLGIQAKSSSSCSSVLKSFVFLHHG